MHRPFIAAAATGALLVLGACTRRAPAAHPASRQAPGLAPSRQPPLPPDAQVRRAPEVIGGRRADVWRNQFRATYYTGGQWNAPRAWLVGEAITPQDADAEVAVIRTVRFPAP